jgi:anti-sigma B factor antagonist
MLHYSSSPHVDLEPFRVEVHPERQRVRVVPIGELDIATVDEIDARLRDLNQAGFRRFVLDLRRLTFIDSSGVRLVLTWHAAARQNGIDFLVLEGPPAVQRVFEVAGLLDQLPFRT